MTPTREQYELAAKAAGIELHWENWTDYPTIVDGHDTSSWAPHEDKADAFSLLCAIKGGLWFEAEQNEWYALIEPTKGPPLEITVGVRGDSQQDIEAAAREAIFMCAVEVGRGMG